MVAEGLVTARLDQAKGVTFYSLPEEPEEPEEPPARPPTPAASAVPENENRQHVHRVGDRVYGDTQLIRIAQRMPGYKLKDLGMGEFSVVTPQGDIEFDRMRGVDFPGQEGRSHLLYGKPPEALAAFLDALGLGDLAAAARPAAPTTPAAPAIERPLAEYKSLGYHQWGIAVEGPEPKPGEKIKVQTKKGVVKVETVESIVGPGVNSQGKAVTVCRIVQTPR
jgi:hypothetical protein